MSQSVEPHTMRWTKAAYYAAAEGGAFADRRVELIEGAIIEMSPMSSKHAIMIHRVQRVLERVFPVGSFVRAQIPLDLGASSEPQPDVAVDPGSDSDYMEQKPTHAVLVVEVSDSSLRYDRTTKASLYAMVGIAEYWIVNLRDRTLELYRSPVPMDGQPFGAGYKVVSSLSPQDLVSPLAAPTAVIPVADLLP
jgi:Uma2 family endonuclease